MDTEITSQVQPEVIQEGGEQPVEGAVVTEPSEDEAQPSEQPKEAGDVRFTEEQVQERIKEAEAKAKSAISSVLDKQIAAERKGRQEAERKVQQSQVAQRTAPELQQVMQDIAMREANLVKTYGELGADTTPIKEQFQRERQYTMALYNRFVEEQNQSINQKAISARDLVYREGLTEEDIPLLLSTQTPKEMELTAKMLKIERAQQTQKVQQASQKKQPQTFHNVAGARGGATSDDEFVKRMGDPNYSPTQEDYQRNRKLLDKLYTGG